MSRNAAVALLTDLRRRAVRLGVRGDRLRVRAPRGVVSQSERDALRSHKVELLKRLELEAYLFALSLNEFAQQNYSIELAVPSLDETIWFVPRSEHIDDLVLRNGVHRGQIWTVAELKQLISATGLTDQDLISLGRLKLAFGGEIDIAGTEVSS